jgi:hypothetical protein
MDVSDAHYQMLYEGLRMGRDFFSRNTGRVLWCYGPDFECMIQGLLDARWLQSNAGRLTSDPDYHRGEFDLTDALVNHTEDLLEYDFIVRDGDVGGTLWCRNAIECLLADGDVVEMTTNSVRDWVAGLGDDGLDRISETRRWFERNAKALAVQQDLISSGDEERIVEQAQGHTDDGER